MVASRAVRRIFGPLAEFSRVYVLQKPFILVLTTSYPSHEEDPSGVFIARLLASIMKRGYEIGLVAPSDGTFYGRRVIDGIETVRFGYFWPRSLEKLTRAGGGIPENMSKSFLARFQILPMMVSFLIVSLKEARRCDLIYANWIGAGIIGALLNLFTRKPLVVSFRGDDGYLARDRVLWRFLTKWVSRRAAVVAPVSGELLQILADLGVPDKKCRLPRFGVDTKMFRPATHRIEHRDMIRLLFVGSLIPRKGLHDLLKALADPAFNKLVLEVVGDGYYRQQLKVMCEELGLQHRTHWRGMLPPEQVARVMRASDLLCLPSYMEGRPNVVNEAMASGIPVVATRIGGIPDMILEGETGLLFEPGSIEGMRKCLRTLIGDDELRKRMGRAAHEFLIEAGVSWDSTAQEFDAIFSRLIKNMPDSSAAA